MPKINELPIQEFTSDNIDHCFYVEDMHKPTMKLVPLSKIFDWINDEAIKNGLTVELKEDKIIFITKK